MKVKLEENNGVGTSVTVVELEGVPKEKIVVKIRKEDGTEEVIKEYDNQGVLFLGFEVRAKV